MRTLCDIIYADVTRPVFRTLLHNKNGAPNVLRTTDPKGKLKMKKLVMGNEAIAYGALAAGVSVVTGYPGTPSTEVLETVAKLKKRGRLPDVYVEWSVNEKAALEVAAGASYSGARTLVTMKQVGLNVASDPLMSLEYVGLRGGMVILVADDPGPISSQTEQDTRTFASFSKVPVFDPSSPEEAFAMMPEAYELSEKYETPVFMRPTTRICHANATLEIPEAFEAKKADGFVKDPSRWVIFPRLSFANHKKIEERNAALSDTLSSYGRNSVSGSGRLGIAAGGVSVAYALEALSLLRAENGEIPDIKFMKTATPFPFPEKLAADFLRGLDEVLVFEELDPVIERALAFTAHKYGIGVKILGKLTGDVACAGENSAESAAAAFARFFSVKAPEFPEPVNMPLPVRPPTLCAGCPHRASFYAVKQAMKGRRSVFCGDIGCYTLAAMKPISGMDMQICMGASIGMGLGLRKVLPEAQARKVVSVIGDSTFMHSGLTGLLEMVYNPPPTGHVVVVVDNSTTALTLSSMGNFLVNTAFPGAKAEFFLVTLTLAAGYGAALGIEGLSRAALLLCVAFSLGLFLILLGVADRVDPVNMRLFPTSEAGASVFHSAWVLSSRSSPAFAFACLFHRAGKDGIKKGFGWYLLASLLLQEFVTFLISASLGELAAGRAFPLFTLTTVARVSVFQRMDALHLGVWVAVSFLRVAVNFRACRELLKPFFGSFREEKGKWGLLIFLMAAASGLSIGMSRGRGFLQGVLRVLSGGAPLSLVLGVVPLCLFLLLRWKKRGQNRVVPGRKREETA